MLKKLLDELLLREDLAEFQNEINEENRIALSMLAYSGILLGIVNLVTQAVADVNGHLHTLMFSVH